MALGAYCTTDELKRPLRMPPEWLPKRAAPMYMPAGLVKGDLGSVLGRVVKGSEWAGALGVQGGNQQVAAALGALAAK